MAEATRLTAGLSGPTWILAYGQTAGRGRRGRDWLALAGNFAATLVYRPQGSLAARAQRSFVAALALLDALVAATGRDDDFRLKWPNDVLINDRKIAGILLESAGDSLSVGIGVNLLDRPQTAALERRATPAQSLASATGIRLTPDAFLDLLAPAYAIREAQFTTYGFAPIRADWLARAARLGEQITARTGTDDITGIFETVDADGVLVLKTPEGQRKIPAADIFFPAPREAD